MMNDYLINAFKENMELPKQVLFIIQKLEQSGYEAYVVGGCVRDSLLNKKPHDYDICTSAKPEEIMDIFSKETVVPTGIKHGTVSIVIEQWFKSSMPTIEEIENELRNR